MNQNNFVMSFSGGKDSVLAMYRMIKNGYKPIALITTVKKDEDKSWTHGIAYKHLKQIEESLNIPLILVRCNSNDYEKSFEDGLLKAKEMGAKTCVFGDIDIEEHKKWNEDRCNNVGLKARLPLWKESREKILFEFIDSGFTTVINKVNLKYLGSEFLGKKLDKKIAKAIELRGADICGENGEYHTFVVDGPIYKFPIELKLHNIEEKDGYGHIIIE